VVLLALFNEIGYFITVGKEKKVFS
jgi:hypothetical protein